MNIFVRDMVVVLLVGFLVAEVSSSSLHVAQPSRSGKFMRFENPDEVFSDVLDEGHDPLVGQTGPKDANSTHPGTKDRAPLYGPKSGQLEVIASGRFTVPLRSSAVTPPADNGVVFYKYRTPSEGADDGNKTGEVKIFWSSVTDAIESLPFIPLQVNVPDMITAMANFLSTSIPIINRFTNPNNPRLPGMMYHDGNEIVDPEVARASDGKLRREGSGERKSSKERKSQKRKGSKSKRKGGKGSSSRGIIKRPILRRTTEVPADDMKIWQSFGSGEPGSVVKNMPITRRKFLIRDREVFNFKNSDLRNSPIMIVNIPNRPMMYYKTKVQQSLEEGNDEGKGKLVNQMTGVHRNVVKADNRTNVKKRVRGAGKQKTGNAEAKAAKKN